MGAGHAVGAATREFAARDAAVPALRPARAGLRRLQDAASAAGGAGGREAARARRQPAPPGQGGARTHAAADPGPAWGYRLRARLSVRYVAKKGTRAGGLSRAQVALRGRHDAVPGAAGRSERTAAAPARTDRLDGTRATACRRSSSRWATRFARWCCAISSRCAAADRDAPARVWRRARRAMVAAARWARTAWCRSMTKRDALCYQLPEFGIDDAVSADGLHAGQSRDQPRAGVARLRAPRCGSPTIR